MSANSEIITFDILGTRLQLRGGDNPDAVMKACQMVYEQAEAIRERASTVPTLQIALMTAINIAHELLQVLDEEKGVDAAAQKANSILKKTIIK